MSHEACITKALIGIVSKSDCDFQLRITTPQAYVCIKLESVRQKRVRRTGTNRIKPVRT